VITADTTPSVSVVIPAHNAAAHLGECLDSVRSQSGDVQFEIVVVDDASTDGTVEVAASRPNVIGVRLPTNSGPSRARNAGVAASRGEFVAFLDADDLWPGGSLAARLAVLQRHPEAALVFGDCRQFDAGGLRAQSEFEANGLGVAAWGPGEIVPNAYWRLLADNFVTTGSVLVRRSVLDEVGGFAEDLRLVEDLDLWLRITHSHSIAWCSQVCLLRRRHEGNVSRDAQAMSRAYLTVIERQRRTLGPSSARVEARFAMLRARELRHMADAAWAAGDARTAALRARESLAVRWHWRTTLNLTRAWLVRARPWRRMFQRHH
jgi:glycosyltransferase involved in cell wall biosynthesis